MSEDGIVVAEEADATWGNLQRIDYQFTERGVSFLDTLRSWSLFKEALADQNEAAPHVHLFMLILVVCVVSLIAGLITIFA